MESLSKMKKKYTIFTDIAKNKLLYIMLIPTLTWFVVFRYLPLAGIIIAFKKYNYQDGIFGSKWCGLDNFEYFFKSGKALHVTMNTMLYNILFLAVYVIFSAIVAIFLAEIKGKMFKKISQTIMFLPYFISWVVLASIVYKLFDYDRGVINDVVRLFGGEPLNIATDKNIWYFLLPFLYEFKWVGYGSVLYLAAIMGLDQSCYEAAVIDGANSFQKIRYITIPLIRPTSITLVLLGVGRIMRGDFEMFYQLIGNNGLLMDNTDIIDTFVFRSLLGNSSFGMASASAFYQSILCFIIIITVNGIIKKIDADSALF